MGQKRKASDSLSPFSVASPPSSLSSLSHHNVNAAHPLDFFHPHATSNQAHPIGWMSPEPYYASGMLNSSPHPPTPDSNSQHLNSRTRKRFRDNRPDETTIHQNTLSKLYSAQKYDHKRGSEDAAMLLSPSPTSSRASLASMHSSSSTAINNTNQQKQKAQASLHVFFGGGAASSQNRPPPNRAPLQPPAEDPQSNAHLHSSVSPSTTIAACEDCSAPILLPHPTTDTEMMDLDADLLLTSAGGEGDAYSCVQCCKRVCDTCAVRGDWRMCLECANPGNGFGRNRYGSAAGVVGGLSCGMEAGAASGGSGGEKIWVGGIGWL
jgi:hypothetical protein